MKRCQPTADEAARIRRAVQEAYRSAARSVEGRFAYPVGRKSALGLGYAPEWLGGIPPAVVERFVGVGNPFGLRRPGGGDRILDVGCGAGLDCFVAARMVGPSGRVTGLDLTREMLDVAWDAVEALGLRGVQFVQGSAEELPIESGSVDLVISNGALNLEPEKGRAFLELARVLRPGGTFAAADLVVTEDVPAEVLRDVGAWSQ